MADTFWDNLVPYYGGPLSGRTYLANSDTDSFFIKVFGKDLVGDLTSLAFRPIMDSQLGPHQISPSGDMFIELIAALPKCHYVVMQNERAAKGTSKHLMKKNLTADRFKEAVLKEG